MTTKKDTYALMAEDLENREGKRKLVETLKLEDAPLWKWITLAVSNLQSEKAQLSVKCNALLEENAKLRQEVKEWEDRRHIG